MKLNVYEVTLANDRYLVGKHTTPRFGPTPSMISPPETSTNGRDLHAGYDHSTVEGIIGLLSRLLSGAVEARPSPTTIVRG